MRPFSIVTVLVLLCATAHASIHESCQKSIQCTIVQEKTCDTFVAINRKYFQSWQKADIDAARAAKAKGHTCKLAPPHKASDYEPTCINNRCMAQLRQTK